MAKNGGARGLQDILLQGLGAQTQSSVSTRREERQQLREEKREERQAEREARKQAKAESADSTLVAASGIDSPAGPLDGPIILNLVASGTDLNEVLTGTEEVDSLYGGGGSDIIIGRGNSTGPESLYGGSGNDVIFGNSHIDSAYGGEGDDVVEGNHGDDFLEGNDGNDTLLDGPTTGSADQLVSVSAGVSGAENSDSHADKLAWAGALSDGSGYITGWGAGIGAPVAPPQALKMQKFNNFGQPIGTPVRIDTFFSAPDNLGPFELKDNIRVLGLLGSDSDKFVVIFESEFQAQTQGNSAHTYMLVFDNDDLSTDIAQFQFSDQTDRTQRSPTAVALSNGDLVVGWQENHRDNGDLSNVDAGIYFRKYSIADGGAVTAVNGAASGTVVGNANSDYRVNVTTNGDQTAPEFVLLQNGNLLAAWNSNGNAGEVGDNGVYFRILNYNNATPTAVTGEIRANQTTAGNQEISNKNIAVLANGNFVITWNGSGPGDSQGTFFRIFDQNGAAVTNEALVNQVTGFVDAEATITALPDGGFLVVWARDIDNGIGVGQTNYDIFARQYSANGTPVTNEFQVNTVADPAFLEDQRRPHVTTLPNGLVVITWDSGRDAQINGPGFANRDEEVIQQVFVFSPSTGGNDTMNGGTGLDFVFGQSGNDSLMGGQGDFTDSLVGGSGRDLLFGDSGADALFGGNGGSGGNTDALAGDYVHYADSSAAVQVNLNDALTETGGHAQGDFITGVEHIVGSQFNDSLTGIGTLQPGQESFAIHNSIVGGLGNDNIFGLEGNDSLFGDFLPAFVAGGGSDSLFGGLGNDVMFGGDANDIMTGGAGADTINGDTGLDTARYADSTSAVDVRLNDLSPESGGEAHGDILAGIEHLIGSNFNDTLIGNAVGNDIGAGGGNDFVVGNQGNDVLRGEGGNDILVDGGGTFTDVYNGGGGTNDTISYLGSTAGVVVNLHSGLGGGGSGADSNGDSYTGIEDIVGSSFGDTLIGSSGDNDIYGDAGIDTLFGGIDNGVDTLFGGNDNDLLADGGGLGADSYFGGAGNDAVSYSGTDTGITANLATGLGSGGIAAGDTYSLIETVLGSSGNDMLIGNAGVNALVGNIGNDTMEGGAGADTIDGGAGQDWASYLNAAARVDVDLTNAGVESGSDAAGDSLVGIEHLIGSNVGGDRLVGDGNANTLRGFGGGDTLFGMTGADRLDGDEGDDTVIGGVGADQLNGGNGSDWASWVNSSASVDVRLTVAMQSGGDAQGDVLAGVEHLNGSSFGDILFGSANDNSIRGSDGNDTVAGGSGAGSDALFGESGDDLLLDQGGAGGDLYNGGANGAAGDTVSYDSQVALVAVNLSAGVGFFNAAAGDTYIGIENLIGGAGNDTLLGNALVNTIVGGGGNDTLRGGDAGDSLDGGAGAQDWVDYRDSTAVNVTLGLAGTQAGGHAAGDVLSNLENLRGSDDELTGDVLASLLAGSTIAGGNGDDTMIGNAAIAIYHGGAGSDLVDYRESSAGVTVDLATGTGSGGDAAGDSYLEANGSGVENVLGSTHNDVIIGIGGFNTFDGRGGDDFLFGGSSRDSLIGGEGDDTIRGGSGGDTMDGGAGDNDFADYTGTNTLGVTVDLTSGTGVGGDAGTFTEFLDRLTGIEHLIGSAHNDTLTGDGGVNWLFGAGGGDLLSGLVGDDSLFGGDGNDSALGGDGVDRLEGGSGNDALDGGTGNDTAFGQDGNDVLGGLSACQIDLGADSLFGGTGNDAFFFDPNDAAVHGGIGNDVLFGRSVADQIQLDAARFQFDDFADIETFDLGDGNDVFLNTSSVSDLVDIGAGLNVFGGSGRDQISMRGQAGAFSGMDDNVDGGAGNDIIWGGFGNDGISGGEGDDQLYGGKGDEKLDGGQGFDVFYIGQAEGNDLIFDDATEVNGLVLFWGWDSTFAPPSGSGADVFDGVDPSEIEITYAADSVTITFLERGGSVTFERSLNLGGTWDSTIDVINLWDYGNGDAGNSPTAPPTFGRDVWAATFDGTTGEFTAFTLVVNG